MILAGRMLANLDIKNVGWYNLKLKASVAQRQSNGFVTKLAEIPSILLSSIYSLVHLCKPSWLNAWDDFCRFYSAGSIAGTFTNLRAERTSGRRGGRLGAAVSDKRARLGEVTLARHPETNSWGGGGILAHKENSAPEAVTGRGAEFHKTGGHPARLSYYTSLWLDASSGRPPHVLTGGRNLQKNTMGAKL